MGRKRIELKAGDVVGPHGVVFLEEMPSRVQPSGRKARMILAVCSSCRESWEVNLESLKSGRSSCCEKCRRKKFTEVGHNNATHGHYKCIGKLARKHPKLYKHWVDVIKRTHFHPGYAGKVFVWPRWEVFSNFVEDILATIGEPPDQTGIQFDRQSDHYLPGFMKWTAAEGNARNLSSNRHLILWGMKKCLVEWCELLDRSYYAVKDRINKHKWTTERALLTPTKSPFKHSAHHNHSAALAGAQYLVSKGDESAAIFIRRREKELADYWTRVLERRAAFRLELKERGIDLEQAIAA